MPKMNLSKKLLVMTLATAFMLSLGAVPASAGFECTVQCLVENRDCQDSDIECAIYFEMCVHFCEEDAIAPASQESLDPLPLEIAPELSLPVLEVGCQV